MNEKVNIAIAVSGKGRSLENFLKGEHPFAIAAVISSNPNAGAIQIALEHELPTYIYDFKNPDAEGLDSWLKSYDIEWIALAGFLKIFPVLPSYANRVTNIHPALLPKHGGHGMYGMRVHESVSRAGEEISGATIHFVNERYDEGAIIAQGQVSLDPASSPEAIAQKVFDLECELYPRVMAKLVTRELPLNDGRIWQYRSEKC